MEDELDHKDEEIFERLLQHIEDGSIDDAMRDDENLREALRLLHDADCAMRCGQSREEDVERELNLTMARLASGTVDSRESAPRRRKRLKYVMWGLLGGIGIGAAAMFLMLFTTGYFTKSQAVVSPAGGIVLYTAKDVFPDGHTGSVEKSVIVENCGEERVSTPPAEEPVAMSDVEVFDAREHKAVSTEECVITTPIGKTMKIILADGTDVLLNPESSLRFPLRFRGEKRTVRLEGEAYFAVAKDPRHPFNVLSQDFCTTALGTEFDVRAYTRADLRVTLIEGSVHVENTVDRSSVILKPGEDVTSVDGKFVVSSVDKKAFKFWRDGYFYFDDVPLADMMVELGRWYNVNVVLNSRSLMSYRLHFVSGRDEDVKDVVSRLNKFGYLNVVLDGDRIVIDERK